MAAYKKIIFIRAIQVRIDAGEGTVNMIVNSYTKLTDNEKQELLREFGITK